MPGHGIEPSVRGRSALSRATQECVRFHFERGALGGIAPIHEERRRRNAAPRRPYSFFSAALELAPLPVDVMPNPPVSSCQTP